MNIEPPVSTSEEEQTDQEELLKQEKQENEKQQKREKKHNIPEFDPLKNPPKLILIQGPPKSGKTTLIKSLVKHYTKINIKDPKGPITIRTSRKQRITLLECSNSISQMADLAKIPDIVLTMVDSSLGFEMQTFEFLSILQIHGFPKCLGVVSHLDSYPENKRKQRIKKQMKKRFAVEVSKETKLFFLSGLKNDLYAFRDIHNLARLISVINPRELEFKKKHPHMLVDRFDLLTTKPSYKDKDRIDVACFGYLRGGDLLNSRDLYMSGLGFLTNNDIKVATDPCPPALLEIIERSQKRENKDQLEIEIEKDFVNESDNENNNTNGNNFNKDGKKDEKKVVKKSRRNRTLKKREKLIFAPQSNLGLNMFDESGDYVTIPDKYVVFTQKEGQDEEIKNHEGVKIMREMHYSNLKIDTQLDNTETFLIDGVKLEAEEKKVNVLENVEKQMNFVSELAEKVHKENAFFKETKREKAVNLYKIIYENFDTKTFLANDKENIQNEAIQANEVIFDSTKFYVTNFESREYYVENVKEKFITGGFEDNSDDESQNEEYENIYYNSDLKKEEENLKKLTTNLIEKGKYIKITIRNLKFSVYKQFSSQPIIISQTDYGEKTRGFLLVKFKRQRWYNSLLKTNDPIIFSVGFHKFQSLPYYCKKDEGERYRLIKYTPRYDFCFAIFYGNYVPNNTGLVAFQTIDEKWKKFRVAGTGVVMGFSQHYNIKKKLKLIGEPFKIFKNTAYVKGMFNSDLEIAKFTGAKIKTVSGIRGQIKKGIKEGKEGSFRATFEDKILMSDIVICRTWYNLVLDKFYNPIVSFDEYKLLKTTWELRNKYGIAHPNHRNSYKDVKRPDKKFMPLLVPKNLRKNLPFKTQDKINVFNQKKDIEITENNVIKTLSTDSEKQAIYLIQRLKAIAKDKKKNTEIKRAEKKRWKEKWDEGNNRKKNYFRKKREDEYNKIKFANRDRKKK